MKDVRKREVNKCGKHAMNISFCRGWNGNWIQK